MHKVKITTVGSSTGITIPKDLLAHMGGQKGDEVLLVPTERGFEVVLQNSEFMEQLNIALEGMERYKVALRALAK